MKLIKYIGAVVIGAYTVLFLTACPGTSNGSNNTSTTAAVANTCSVGFNGQLVNQYGQPCNSGLNYGCAGYTYNPQTGTYINPTTGQQIPVSACGGTTNGVGGIYPGGTAPVGSGCQGWTQYYQSQGYYVQYVPVQMNGTLVCVDFSQMQQYNPGYYNNLYSDPNYWYYYPPVAYQAGYYGSYGYNQCATNVSLGFGSGGGYGGSSFGVGLNLCF